MRAIFPLFAEQLRLTMAQIMLDAPPVPAGVSLADALLDVISDKRFRKVKMDEATYDKMTEFLFAKKQRGFKKVKAAKGAAKGAAKRKAEVAAVAAEAAPAKAKRGPKRRIAPELIDTADVGNNISVVPSKAPSRMVKTYGLVREDFATEEDWRRARKRAADRRSKQKKREEQRRKREQEMDNETAEDTESVDTTEGMRVCGGWGECCIC